jgi:ATP-binding cassette subfamily B protein
MSSAERIFGALELKEEEGLRKDNTSLTGEPRLTGEIRFDHVSFSYSEKMDTWALRDANFHITPQERIAVVGHSGAGKSTLLSLLFRFYQPQRGSILLDGRPIESFSKHFLRRRLGFVQQDVFIFAGTIRENLTLLGDSITEEKLNAACDATGMNQILARLEAGLETRLDERGSNLSLGERQVLAITRVLLQDPDILILDEATSHVDNSTERLLQKAIEQVTKNRTSILIAHRLSTIRDADRIFVFEKGAIVESGTHDELVTAQGAYYSFSKLQTL